MAALLDGIDDEAWLFWAIDDRYPIQAAADQLDRLARAVMSGEAQQAAGVRLVRWREGLSPRTTTLAEMEFRFQQAGELHGFWLHQFLRAGVLREMFLNAELPATYSVRELHEFYLTPGRFQTSSRMLVPGKSLAAFAEPCKRGQLISSALADLIADGCSVPDYPVVAGSAIYSDQTRG